jgi:hypothetical protein
VEVIATAIGASSANNGRAVRIHCDYLTIMGLLSKEGEEYSIKIVPNDDRVSPPVAASFAMQMPGSTPARDAYTLAEYTKMFEKAGFASSVAHRLEKSPMTLIVSTKG